MKHLWNFLAGRKGNENNANSLSERDWLFIKLCQDGWSLETWKACAEELISSVAQMNRGEVQLLLDALSQNPHPDRVASILLVLETAMKEHDNLQPLLATPSSLAIISDILGSSDRSNINQLGLVLLQLEETSSVRTMKAFVPLLLDQIRKHLDREEVRTPIVHDMIQLMRKWMNYHECWLDVEDGVLLILLTDLLVIYPYDVNALYATFLFLQRKGMQLKYADRTLFHLFVRIFLKTTVRHACVIENHELVAWIAAGIMCSLGHTNQNILEDVVKYHLPVIAALKPIIDPTHGMEMLPLQVIDSIMMMLIKASRHHPDLMRFSTKVLWQMMMESPWAIKTTIRKVLVNIGEAVDRRKSLKACSVDDLRKILFEHGIRQECIDRLNLPGKQFLQIPPDTLAEILDLTPEETQMVEKIQKVYQMMVKITKRKQCAKITHDEMERYLEARFPKSSRQLIVKPIRSAESLDANYYFYSLMDVAHLLDELNDLDREP